MGEMNNTWIKLTLKSEIDITMVFKLIHRDEISKTKKINQKQIKPWGIPN
jgi:hypothetical protein